MPKKLADIDIPENIRLEVYKEAVRKALRGSLYLTCRELLGYKDINWRTHGSMILALESNTKRKLLCVPRGTLKSSIGSIAYPIWRLIRDPNDRILLDSEIYTNSKNFLREVKGHLKSEMFVDIFGDWETATWNESEIIIAPRTRMFKEASITCGGIGTTKVGQHYDCIIGDDYNSPANSATPEQRKKVIDHYQMSTAILETDGVYAVIGTRYAEDDLIGWIIRNELGFDSLADFQSLKREKGVINVSS